MQDRRHRLVPNDFDVPDVLEHSRFRLRMLTVNRGMAGDADRLSRPGRSGDRFV